MTYDVLNRVRSKVYSGLTPEGTAVANATPPVNFFYDDYSGLPSGAPAWPGTPSKGRLVGVTYGPGSEGTYYKYDAAGRIVTNHQRMGTSNYATAYFYNRADAVTREERGIPARRRILMGYDAAGRLATMDTGSYPFLTYVPLVGNVSYTPFGGLQSETYGNGLIHSMGYNNRLQPTEIRLGRPDNLESVFTIYPIYGTTNNVNSQDAEITAAHNNGNIARIRYSVSGTIQYTQTFQYDQLNRLRYAVEHNNGVRDDGARAWYQTFDYDQYGNRGINVANTSDNVDAANSALQRADFSGADNRITRAGFVYDDVGNLIVEPGKSYTYDAENRIVTATLDGGATSQYLYDGNGRRVKKIVGGVATRFEYGKDDELIAEWNDADSPNKNVQKDYFYKGGELFATKAVGSSEYQFATSDHLGSPRAWTDGYGNLIAGGRHDYLPFGEELSAGVGIRSASLGYGDDSVRQKFTSKVRDAETGLDYFGARYFSSVQGRFTSVDEAPPKLINPQTLNKYRYALNNPLYYIDPDGNQEKKESFLDWLSRVFWERCGWKNDETNPREKPPELVLPGAPPDMSSDELHWQYARRISEGFDAWDKAIMIIDPTHASSIISIVFDLHQGNYGGVAIGAVLIPLGFKNLGQFENFGSSLKSGLTKVSDDAVGIFQGSAITGKKYTTGAPFDVGRVSDFDIGIASSKLLDKAKELGVRLRSGGSRTGELTSSQIKKLGLADLQKQLSMQAGRHVNFMLFRSVKDAAEKAPSIVVK